MSQQMTYCKHRRVGRQVFEILQLLQVDMNRIIKSQFPLITQLQYRQRCEALCHRSRTESGGRSYRPATGQIIETAVAGINQRHVDYDTVTDTRQVVFQRKGTVQRVNGFSQPIR